MSTKVSFIEGNRVVNDNNVKKHMQSLKKFGRNLVPMLYVNSDEVSEDLTLTDAQTGQVVTDRTGYRVLLDGQHRYTAALRLAEAEDKGNFAGLEAMQMEHCDLNGLTFSDVLAEINSCSLTWKGSDFIAKAYLEHGENEVVAFAKELADYGLSSKTINKLLFWSEKHNWRKYDEKKTNKAQMERAKKIWDVILTFPHKFAKTSVWIDYLIVNGRWDADLEKMEKLTDEQKDTLTKGTVGSIRTAFEKLMADN